MDLQGKTSDYYMKSDHKYPIEYFRKLYIHHNPRL